MIRSNKAFDIHENSYRLDADVVAAFQHRRYISRDFSGQWKFLVGTQFFADDGTKVINWPEQQYANGVNKNEATGRRYKAIARIFKYLRNEMAENGIDAAKPMASFLLECLAFNVPAPFLMIDNYTNAVAASLVEVYQNTETVDKCADWREVNELKYLFRGPQTWSCQQVNAFTAAAWQYFGGA